jgi:hypothetical protein
MLKSLPGAFSTLRPRRPIVFLPQQVPAFFSRGATHHTDARDLYQRRRELPPNFASGSEFTRIPLGFFYMPQSWDMGHIILLPLRRKAYWGFFGCPKNPTGLNPRTRVPVASMLTTRPPKPTHLRVSHLLVIVTYCNYLSSILSVW